MTYIVHDAKNRIESIWRRKIGRWCLRWGNGVVGLSDSKTAQSFHTQLLECELARQ